MTPDIVISGPKLHTTQPYQTIHALLFDDQFDDHALFVGPDDQKLWTISRADVQRLSLNLDCPDRIAIVRLPHTSDAPHAALSCAALATGKHVLMPTTQDELTHCPHRPEAIFADLSATPDAAYAQDYRAQRNALTKYAQQHHIPLLDLRPLVEQTQPTDTLHTNDSGPSTLSITTSGTTGTPKWLDYTEDALLGSVYTWQAANLLTPTYMGGHSLNLLLSHSMGIRDMIRALWCGKRMLTILPAWMTQRPYQLVRTLCDHPIETLTCGPAILATFEQYLANFPMLYQHLLPSLRCVISSGTAHHGMTTLPKHIKLANAFGMSETMQVTTTLLHDDPLSTLGHPLPGVDLGLTPTKQPHLYNLWVRTSFGAHNAQTQDGWLNTGDQVHYQNQQLTYHARREPDFVQTGLGFKLHRQTLHETYSHIPTIDQHLEIIAHPNHAYPIALMFLGDTRSKDTHQRIQSAFEATHNTLSGHDLNFATIHAIGLIDGPRPHNPLGKYTQTDILTTHRELIDALLDPLASHPNKIDLHHTIAPLSDTQRHSYPYLARLIEGIELDWHYIGGHKDTLIAKRNDQEIEVLDGVGGYGVNLLGHNDPVLKQAAHHALDQHIALSTQTSARPLASQLARALSTRLGQYTNQPYITCLASTGSEAVDLALKHALLAHRAIIDDQHHNLRTTVGHQFPELVQSIIDHNSAQLKAHPPVLLALEHGFHGKTLGPLSTLWDHTQRQPFEPLLGLQTHFIPRTFTPEHITHLQNLLDQHQIELQSLHIDQDHTPTITTTTHTRVMGILVEPISGEGGVHVVDHRWLKHLSTLPIPLIVDEIQCGLGRSGQPFAISPINPDYLLLGKALGGGIAKIAALLIAKHHYQPHFDLYRGSTFAEDDFSCAIALATLDRLDDTQAAKRAQDIGNKLHEHLTALQKRHPQVITHIDGQGLMWGITLHHPDDPPSTVTATMARKALGYLSSAYLLNVHHVRLLPTTSAPNTLRIEPSIHFNDDNITQLIHALDALCDAWRASNLFELLAHLCGPNDQARQQQRMMAKHYSQMSQKPGGFTIVREPPAPEATKIAFVHNPVHTTKLLLADAPPFALLSSEARLELIDRFTQLLEFCPMPSFSKNLYGGKVWMMGITMAITPAILHILKRTNQLKLIQTQLQHALDIAAEHGCTTVVFGAQTSIVSHGATSLHPPKGIQVSSGNTLTTAVAMNQLQALCATHHIDLSDRNTKIAIVGATGSIGQAISKLLIRSGDIHAHVVLVGRQGSKPRLQRVWRDATCNWPPHAHHLPPVIDIAEDLNDLNTCDVIIAATNTAEPIIFNHHVHAEKTVVIADLSEPSAIAQTVSGPNIHVFQTGFVTLPQDPDFVLSAHSPMGTSFACAAEGILMGLEPQPDLVLCGDVESNNVLRLQRLSKKWGMHPVRKA